MDFPELIDPMAGGHPNLSHEPPPRPPPPFAQANPFASHETQCKDSTESFQQCSKNSYHSKLKLALDRRQLQSKSSLVPTVELPSKATSKDDAVFEQFPKFDQSKNSVALQQNSTSIPGISATNLQQNWRDHHQTLVHANKHLLSCEELLFKFSDCSFIVGPSHETIPAYRLMLIARSDVLENLLVSQSKIEVPEVSPESFKAFLLFLCTDEFNAQENVISEMLHLSHKFNVSLLKQKCCAYIASRMQLGNCVNIYQIFGRNYDPDGLEKLAFEFIIRNFTAILKSAEFLRFDVTSLARILASDDLLVNELEVFTAVIRWAENHCDTNGWPKSVFRKRQLLKPLLPLVRFPLMTTTDFASKVQPQHILTSDESLRIFTYLNTTPQQRSSVCVAPFSKSPRKCTTKTQLTQSRRRGGQSQFPEE